ncbi:hypothetical protein [Actinomycetospora cinnamomea]|uniref:Uncharacterized protein n=1 Tax=Actinomycetospora cinnamomea TaxID=663609 RepID=A0A2U1F9N8_9PSEU|nr:hypothetical protein [Actinomycetospora cinnamomea]PVZ08905.1 hypothetical protein C8D89_10767 [Actinomycetospora cinnamomea]
MAVVLAVVLVVALATAWVAGSSSAPGEGTGSTDATRLGPGAGETVAGYLGRARTVPPGPPGPRPALVAFTTGQDPAGAAAALAGVGVREAVFRVPLPRVQTALRRVSVDDTGAVDLATALRLAETQAANRAGELARTGQGRPATVAATESARLAAGCACIVAAVVEIDPAGRPGVPALTARPGVRAVEVAPPGARIGALAVSPLLPEQTDDGRDPPETVGPVPDDGPVPPP